MTERAVHPAAAVFPMLAEDELRELAEDIRANGLIHPIKIDKDGAIVDGRNRDAACRLAGVEPRYETLNGHDPVTFILSANIHRRHMSAGQRAMAVAHVRILDSRNVSQVDMAERVGVSHQRVSQAEAILKFAADLAPGVLAGTEAFDKVYDVARARKRELDEKQAEDDRRARRETLELERLRRVAPDLAALVPETLSVADAKAAFEERERRDRQAREATTALAAQMLSFLDPGVMSAAEAAGRIVPMLDAALLPSRPDLSVTRFERCSATFAAILAALVERSRHGES